LWSRGTLKILAITDKNIEAEWISQGPRDKDTPGSTLNCPPDHLKPRFGKLTRPHLIYAKRHYDHVHNAQPPQLNRT
jgi:hypothetical protein